MRKDGLLVRRSLPSLFSLPSLSPPSPRARGFTRDVRNSAEEMELEMFVR